MSNTAELNDLCYREPDPWRALAACRGKDPAIFFPEPMGPCSYDAARAICASCPVKAECLETAGNDDGFRGGMAPRERAVWRGKQRTSVRRCELCRQPFRTDTYRTVAYCSDECRNRIRAARARAYKARLRCEEAS